MRVAGQDELQAKLRKRLVPWGASLEITSRCNLSCAHCLRGPAKPDDGLTYDQVCDLLDQLAGLGCLQVTFTGGEPFCRQDFLQILEEARRQNLASVVLTNGTVITALTAAALRDLQVYQVQVSLYGASAGVHEAVTRVAGSFSATVRALDLLVHQGLRVRVMMPVLVLNAQDVGAVRGMCETMGVEFRRSLLIFPGDDGSTAPLDLQPSERQLRQVMAEEKKLGLLSDGEEASPALPARKGLCSAGIQQIGIGLDGQVYPCGALRVPAGNLFADGLGHIWQEAPILQWLRGAQPSYSDSCAGCQVRESCFWCPGLSLTLEGEMTIPNRQDCRRTRVSFGGSNCGRI